MRANEGGGWLALTRAAGAADVVRHGAFFFIENVFFDTEWEGDATPAASVGGGSGPGLLSDPCRRWLAEERKRRRTVGPTFLRSVHTPLRAVHARLGAHYLYRHQGDCEHRVRFTGVRLLTEADPGDTLEYPRQVYQGSVSRRKCYACKARFAQCVGSAAGGRPRRRLGRQRLPCPRLPAEGTWHTETR